MDRVSFKKILENISLSLMQEFNGTAKIFGFPPDRGAPREERIREFLKKNLPRRYGVTSGLIISSDGTVSNQSDIIIYDADTSPIFYSDERQKILPIESIYSVIEIKSQLSSDTLDKAIKNIKTFKKMPRKDETSIDLFPNVKISSNNKPLNRKVGALITYSLGEQYNSQPTDEVLGKIVSKIRNEPTNERIDFVCIIDKGLIVPTRQKDNIIFLSISDDSYEFRLVGNNRTSVGLFVGTLLSVLNNIKLGKPDFFAYFKQ